MEPDIAVVIPSWNAAHEIRVCLDSLRAQSIKHKVYVVENGSTDDSVDVISRHYPEVTLLVQQKNLGFAGGVNVGIRQAMDDGIAYVALFNNDAVADKHWLKHLRNAMRDNPKVGAVACAFLNGSGTKYDSTGDFYCRWGLLFPRDRDMPAKSTPRKAGYVFGASGGSSLYRMEALRDVGLFDEDFFAYYEDGDLSFRLQLRGWKIFFEPKARALHHTGTTSSKIPGFTTYQTFKNIPLVLIKNVPLRLLPGIALRLWVAYASIFIKSVMSGRGWPATKGFVRMLTLLPKKIGQRWHIQHSRSVPTDYIRSIIVWDLPPNAQALRRLRNFFMPWHR